MRRGACSAVLAGVTGAALALAGCNTLLGLDGVAYRGAGGDAGVSEGGSGGTGGGSGSGGAAGATTFSQACVAMAEGGCGFYERCYPDFLKTYYSSLAQCKDLYLRTCAPFYDLPASHTTPADLAACAAAYADAPCEAVAPYSCRFPPGDVAAGGACAASTQCATGYCNGSSATSCGVCGPSPVMVVPSGGSCGITVGLNVHCVSHNACIGGTCQPVALEGESCAGGATCSPEPGLHLACRGGVCVRTGRAGDACDAEGTCAPGFLCESTANTCQPIPEVPPGQPCISSFNTRCVGGFCDCTNSANRVCRAFPGGGQPCLPTTTCGSTERCAKGLACKDGLCALTEVGPPTSCGPQ